MSKRMLWALVLIGLTVLVLILNTGGRPIEVNLGFGFALSQIRAIIYLAFVAVGVVIGVLVR